MIKEEICFSMHLIVLAISQLFYIDILDTFTLLCNGHWTMTPQSSDYETVQYSSALKYRFSIEQKTNLTYFLLKGMYNKIETMWGVWKKIRQLFHNYLTEVVKYICTSIRGYNVLIILEHKQKRIVTEYCFNINNYLMLLNKFQNEILTGCTGYFSHCTDLWTSL